MFAIDTDNSGSIEKSEVQSFVKDILFGVYKNSEITQRMEERNKLLYIMFDDEETEEITDDILGKFLREFFKG